MINKIQLCEMVILIKSLTKINMQIELEMYKLY